MTLTKPKIAEVEKQKAETIKIKKMNTKKIEQESSVKEIMFDSEAVKIEEFEERNEMIVLWRRGEGFLPDLRRA